MKSRLHIVCAVALLIGVDHAFAQFSPGELSKAHQQFEGINNCLKCHETGNEISGKKCLECHLEIQDALNAKHGYHFRVSAQKCVACHKEHLGREEHTTRFDKNAFDHKLTGFERTGKHASIKCEDCHTKKNIKNPQVLKVASTSVRQTYLGLGQACIDCHEDRHNGTVGKDCKKCHGTKSFAPVISFDHSKTKFLLAGKHEKVNCTKCHTGLDHKDKAKPLLFTSESFTDCAPCHASPHSREFVTKACNSCHSPEGWKTLLPSSKFNHDLTAFKLLGKHVGVACEKCHKSGVRSLVGKSMRLAHNRCTDCHADYHNGEFTAKFKNDCEKCHTVSGFQFETFTLAMHNEGRFALTGAHIATPCGKCHTKADGGRRSFHFLNLRCEACHKDKHGGQFVKEMVTQSCAACHATKDWAPKDFDHAKTKFALVGKHAQTKCEDCHKPKVVAGVQVAQYKGINMKCENCHKEIHAGQFTSKGESNCALCHRAQGWKSLVFNHDAQSTFALTGAHKRVECNQCHREERRAERTFVRYKPIPTKCESCHAPGSFGNG